MSGDFRAVTFNRMRFDDPEVREAYRRGVRDACDNVGLHVAPPKLRACEQWIRDLETWDAGEPPVPPERWSYPPA